MKQRSIALLLAGMVLTAPACGFTQSTATQAQDDQQLRQDQAGERAAYKSGNKAEIAAARTKARAAYARDYGDHHPRNGCARAGAVDHNLAVARANTSAAYKSGDAAKIAADRAAARPDFAAAYADRHCAGAK